MLTLQSLNIKNLGSYENETYSFSRNKLRIIIGINKDSLPLSLSNSSLEELLNGNEIPSNGSGKSMIAEGLSIALFGEPIRKDITIKDLIRKGQDHTSISLICCSNTIDNVDKIEIKRTIFSSRKPAELEVIEYIGDIKNEVHKSSIDETNKFILSRYIGISKENLLNYFIIQKDRYKPFLQLSDNKKKEMIAEFTGINQIEFVKDELKIKINDIQKDKDDKERELISLDSKLSYIEGQLNSIPDENKYSREIKGRNLADNNSILFYSKEIEKLETEKSRLNLEEEQKKVKEEISKLKIDIQNQLKSLEDENFNNELKENESRKGKIFESLNNCKEKLNSLLKDQVELNKRKSSYEVKLGGVVECPKCKNRFNSSIGENEDEVIRVINKYSQCLQNLSNTLNQIENDKKNLESMIEKNIEEKNELLKYKNKIEEKIYDLKSTIIKLEGLYLNNKKRDSELTIKISELKLNIERLKQDIENRKKLSYDSILEKKKIFELDINRFNESKKNILKEIEDVSKKLSIYNDSLLQFNNFKNFLFDKTIATIEIVCNYYLTQFSKLSIRITNKKLLADGNTNRDEISCSVEKDGFSNIYGILSNGERMAINLAFICTFQHLINTKSRNGLDFLELDEITSSLDNFNQNKLFYSLNNLKKTIEVITHVPPSKDLELEVQYIVKENNTSKIIEL